MSRFARNRARDAAYQHNLAIVGLPGLLYLAYLHQIPGLCLRSILHSLNTVEMAIPIMTCIYTHCATQAKSPDSTRFWFNFHEVVFTKAQSSMR